MGQYAAAVVIVLVMGTSPLYAQDALFVVTTTSADVHKGPSTGSAVIGKASRGKSFPVIRELGSWVSVSWPDAEGVAYLHVAWGRISRGAAAEILGATGAGWSAEGSGSTADPSTTAVRAAQAPITIKPSGPALSLPSHVVGLGGRIGTRAIGGAIAGRAWAHGPLGVQIEAGQSTYTSVVAPGQLRSMHVAPSIMYSPLNRVTNAIWARPYIGAGVNIYRSTLRDSLGVSDAVRHGFGSQVFGGAELTWARLPQFAVSADLRQQWASPPFNGFELGGVGVSMSAHWYVK